MDVLTIKGERMERMLRKESITMANLIIDKQEECPICNEFSLPEYCPDVAVVLKCFAYPRLQNRQWSGDKMLIDGNTIVRILYLDAARCHVRSVEYSLPFACALRSEERTNHLSANIEMEMKYINCRALNPRRLEVRGTVLVKVCAEGTVTKEVCCSSECENLYAKTIDVEMTVPDEMTEKIITISDSLEFDRALPPAHMLLGGECRAVVCECKMLSGKVIVKGNVYVHQLYTDAADGGSTHCLDYCLPYSQILDVTGAEEGVPCSAAVKVLSDTERCVVGPDGELTMLDVTVKLLLQLRTYQKNRYALVRDAYHCHHPLSMQTEKMEIRTVLGEHTEEMVATHTIPMGTDRWSEIIDVLLQAQACSAVCRNGTAEVKWSVLVCVLAKDLDGEVVYDECSVEIPLVLHCQGDFADVKVSTKDYKYRVVEDKLELQLDLCVTMCEFNCFSETVVTDIKVQKGVVNKECRATAMLYYASPGESVWDIGRTCCSSPEGICTENALADEKIVESSVLVVPLVN